MVCACDICMEISERINTGLDLDIVKYSDSPGQFLRGFDIPVENRTYDLQLHVKCKHEAAKWSVCADDIDVIRSPATGHRLRLKFLVGKNKDGRFRFGMKETRDAADDFLIDTFAAATERINTCMGVILDSMEKNEVVGSNLHAVNFIDTLSASDILMCMYYLSQDGDKVEFPCWDLAVKKSVINRLVNAGVSGRITVVRRQKGIVHVVSSAETHHDATLLEKGLFDGKVLSVYEGSFSNPNGAVTRRVNDWMGRIIQDLISETYGSGAIGKGRLIELCSGAGNHTIGLSDYFEHCFCVEIDRNLVDRARINVQMNKMTKVALINGDINRLKILTSKLSQWLSTVNDSHNASKVPTVLLVDPPRHGLEETVASNLNKIPCDFLVYIACGEGLNRNLPQISVGFDLVRICLVDHFPFTHFLEKVAVFRSKAIHER